MSLRIVLSCCCWSFCLYRCRQAAHFDFWSLLQIQFRRATTHVSKERVRRRKTITDLLLLTVHVNLSLIYLVFQPVDCLHYPVSFILELLQKTYILYVVVVHIVDEIRLDHLAGNVVRVLDTFLEFDLQLLILVKFLLLDGVLPLESR